MAQTKRLLIAALGLLLLAAAAGAVSQDDIKKFPPVSGQIYGQAAAGVRSVSVNGKPVAFDSSQNFSAEVKLRPGEKYLVLTINYDNLRIIKKYLILRKSAVSNFKVFVPKEKIEKSLAVLKQSVEQKKAARLKALRALARQRALTAEEQAREREQERLEREREAKERQELAERSWLRRTSSPKFFANEFRSTEAVASLLDQIVAAGYHVPFKARANSLAKLNEILSLPNFYDLVGQKNNNLALTDRLRSLIAETQAYRYRPFARLSAYQQKKIMLLNRLLLEALFEGAPHRGTWQAAGPIPTFTKTKQYLYVWEFSEGRLLAVKQKQGSYSADIYIPVSKKWLSLKGLSEKDLQELIEKPIKSFEPPKGKQEKKTKP
jgi:hypothetical protein